MNAIRDAIRDANPLALIICFALLVAGASALAVVNGENILTFYANVWHALVQGLTRAVG